MMSDSPEILPWDSAHFGWSIARWNETRPDARGLQALRQWMHQEFVDCTYVLVDADATEAQRSLERAGASLTDVRVTLDHPLGDVAGFAPAIRPARPADEEQVASIARSSHRDGRFHADSRLDPERSDHLYEIWARRSVTDGFADAVFVIDVDGEVGGYVTCAQKQDGGAELSLIAVAPHVRGRGAGRDLVIAAIQWSSSVAATEMTVVTQGRNVGAIRLYEGSGFRTQQVQLWYHLWREPVAGSNA